MNTPVTNIAEVFVLNSPVSGEEKIILLAADGELVSTIEGRASFTVSGSWKSAGQIIKEGIDSGRYPNPNQR